MEPAVERRLALLKKRGAPTEDATANDDPAPAPAPTPKVLDLFSSQLANTRPNGRFVGVIQAYQSMVRGGSVATTALIDSASPQAKYTVKQEGVKVQRSRIEASVFRQLRNAVLQKEYSTNEILRQWTRLCYDKDATVTTVAAMYRATRPTPPRDYIHFVRKNCALAIGSLVAVTPAPGAPLPPSVYALGLADFNQEVLFRELDLLFVEYANRGARSRLARNIRGLAIGLRMSLGRPHAVFVINQFFF